MNSEIDQLIDFLRYTLLEFDLNSQPLISTEKRQKPGNPFFRRSAKPGNGENGRRGGERRKEGESPMLHSPNKVRLWDGWMRAREREREIGGLDNVDNRRLREKEHPENSCLHC